ncbi:MAG: ATP-binding protein, partial [Rhodoferax sp.]
VGTYVRVLDKPLAGQPPGQRLVIQVAETLQSRQDFTRALVWNSVARDILLLGAATALMVVAVGWALRPLRRLRNDVQARAAQDLTPISSQGIPADVKPLVDAINFHIDRSRQHAEARQRFVDDASHQLRTPLATLTTQVNFALREANPANQREAMLAIKAQLEETVRQTNQMLALARVDSAEVVMEAVDVRALAEQVTRQWWSDARTLGIDLGLDAPAQPMLCAAQPALVKEALSNLLHNAIRYSPRGAQVTVQLRQALNEVAITVQDTGPGMPAPERARAGERFFRGAGVSQPGSGLGLAIVRSVAERHGGAMRVAEGPDGQGLAVSMLLPRAVANE